MSDFFCYKYPNPENHIERQIISTYLRIVLTGLLARVTMSARLIRASFCEEICSYFFFELANEIGRVDRALTIKC